MLAREHEIQTLDAKLAELDAEVNTCETAHREAQAALNQAETDYANAQAALAVKELEDVLEDLEDTPLESISIDAYFEDAVPAFDGWVLALVRERLGLAGTPADGDPAIEVTSHERMAPTQVFEQTPELEWEVEAFWKVFREMDWDSGAFAEISPARARASSR